MTAWESVVLDVWRHGQQLSAVGPGPVEAHLAHSRALAAQLDAPSRAVDLGSGAGIPGLALAGWWPGSEWLLIDAAQRRVRLLEEAVLRLGWTERVTVRHGRAEDAGRDRAWRGGADLVTARAFGPPAATAECGAPFLALHGVLVVTEPPTPTDHRWPSAALEALGLTAAPSPDSDQVRVQRLVRTGEVPDRIPRRAGMPVKRPLF